MRTQTVVYNFPTLDSLSNNTLTSIGTITANFKNIQNVSIVDAFIVVKMEDIITATGGTITTKRIDLDVNGAGAVTYSDSTTYSHSSENIFWIIPFDVTSTISNNFQSNANNTFALSVLFNQTTGSPQGFVNVCVDLYITYQFDETTSTRILKTAFIPISSLNGALTTSSTNYGSIPALNTYLPENNKFYDNLAIVREINRSDTATDASLTMSIPDLSLSVTSSISEGGMATGRRLIYHWKLDETNYDFDNLHNFYVNSSANNVFYSSVFYLIVTYSFDLTTTTAVLNSLLLGNIGGATGNSTTLFERVETELLIPEGDVSAQRVMALLYTTAENTSSQIRLRIEPDQPFSSAYNIVQSMSSSTRVCAIYSENLQLNQGENNLILDYYTTDTYFPKGMNVLWIVNYSSEAVNGGVDNNRTIITQPISSLTRSGRINITTKICPLAESDYYITNGFFVFGIMHSYSSFNESISAEILTSEGGTSGELIFIGLTSNNYSDTEVGWKFNYYPFDFNKIKRFPGDIASDKMIDVSSSRSLMISGNTINSLFSYTTIHSVTKTISGVVKDSSGSPVSSADVLLFRLTSKPKVMKSTVTDSNGNYSFTVYDNLSKYLVYAKKSGTTNIFDATDSNLSGS